MDLQMLQYMNGGNPKMNRLYFSCAMRGRNPENPSDRTPGIYLEQRLEPSFDGIANALTTVQKDSFVLELKFTD